MVTRLLLKNLTKTKEVVDYKCVFSPDIQLECSHKGKAQHYKLASNLDAELCYFSG